MSGPPHLLANVPPDFTLTAAIIIGSLILVTLVLFHGMGVHYILSYHKGGVIRLRSGRPHRLIAIVLFASAIFLLLTLHIAGVIAWSVILTNLGLISNAKDAIYFCANAYTTLGYGTVDLDPNYKIISPIIGISGLFTFAWTTSAMVGIIQTHNSLLDRLHEEKLKQKQLRLALKSAILNAREREREAERHESIEITRESVGTPLYGRWQRWREEHQKRRALRVELRSEEWELLKKENAAEKALGVPRQAPDDAGSNGTPSAPATDKTESQQKSG
ncbi:MAG: ion channel [Candidatus Acidiferrales bacterium]